MALVRVCDVTAELEPDRVPIQVGSLRWRVDLSRNGQKMLMDALQPFLVNAELIPDGEPLTDPDGDDVSPEGEPEQGPVDAAAGAVGDGPSYTIEDKRAARLWGQKHPNWQRCGLEEPVSNYGQVPAVVLAGWDEAGRPMVG